MSIIERLTGLFTQVKALPEGVYHLQSPVEDEKPFRLHLRLQKDGSGVLILNASTVLQLNPTAAEFAYHLIRGSKPEDAAKEISGRYRISREKAAREFAEFVEKILTLVHSTDLDPVTVLGFEPVLPNSANLSAPLRLDCALNYRLSEGIDPQFAPRERVTRELTAMEWMSILDKAWAAGVPHVVFTGGEATLCDELPALIAHAEKNGQVAGLITDGIKLVDAGYMQSLLETGLDHLMIILPVRGEPNWVAIRNAVKADIFLAVHLTVTPANVEFGQMLLSKLHDSGVENISLSISDSSLHEQVLDLKNFAEEHNFRVISDLPVPYSAANPVSFELSLNDEPKGAGKTWLYIEPDGDVLPSQGHTNEVLGNILKDSWEKIYPK
jgi:hypothetical protein